MKLVQWAILAILVLSFAGSYLAFGKLPGMVASHWNAAGDVDGYMGREMGAFLMPFVAVGLVGLFYLLPRIDPLKKNILAFREYYEGFILVFVLFFAYLHFLTLAWNMGYSFDMGRMMVPAIGLLFIYMGILCGKSRQNWFIGVKSPWTLSSERVWEKTHALARKVYILCGLIWIVVGLLLPNSMLFLVGIVILASLGLFAYSYLAYKKEREGLPEGEEASVSGQGVSPMPPKPASGLSAKAFPLAGRVPGGETAAPLVAEAGEPGAPMKPAKKVSTKKRGKPRSKKGAGKGKNSGKGAKKAPDASRGKPKNKALKKKAAKKKR